jgi:hypothetical protein
MTEKKVEIRTMKDPNPLQVILFFVIFLPLTYLAIRQFLPFNISAFLWTIAFSFIIALIIASAFRIADQWEKQSYSDWVVTPDSGVPVHS